MSTANKLLYLGETKLILKDTINMSNANITNSTTFRNYATQLKEGYIDILNNGTDTLYNNFTHLTGKDMTLSFAPTYQAPMKISCYGSTSQASTPTPSIPVDVVTTTGNQSIEICKTNLAYTDWASDFVSRINDNTKAKLETKDTRSCLWYAKNAGYGEYDTKYMFKRKWKENTQYTFSFDIFCVDTVYCNLDIEYTDGTVTELLVGNNDMNIWAHKVATSTSGKTIKYLKPRWRNNSCYIDINTFMVYEGTDTTTPYEAYNGTNYTIALGTQNELKVNTALIANRTATGLTTSMDIYNGISLIGTSTGTSRYWTGSDDNKQLIKAGTYTFFMDTTDDSIEGAIQLKNASTSATTTYTTSNHKVTFTYTDDFYVYNGKFIVANNTNYNALIHFYMIKGSEVKKASDNPIELCKIGDYEDKIDKSTGKNLNNGLRKGYYSYSTGNFTSDNAYTCSISRIKVNTTNYVFSLNGSVCNGYAYTYDINNNYLGRVTIPSDTGLFQPNSNVAYFDYSFKDGTIANAPLTGLFQINEGSTALPYEPYGTGNWYLKKNIGVQDILSSELGNFSSATNLNNVQFTKPTNDKKNGIVDRTIPVLCNKLAYSNRPSGTYDDSNLIDKILDGGNSKYFVGLPKTITTLEEAQTYLATLKIYYILATPTYTKITDSTLIEQLEAIKSKDNTTNITSSMVIGAIALKKE